MFDYLVEFTDKRDKRHYQYLISIPEAPGETKMRLGAGSTSRESVEARILRDVIDMFSYVRFDDIEIKQLASPLNYKEMVLRPATEHFPG